MVMNPRVRTKTFLGWMLTMAYLAPAAAAAADRFDLDETYTMSPDGTVELTTRDAKVTFVGSDRDDVHVEIHYLRKLTGVGFVGRGFDIEVTRSGGNLSIKETGRRRADVGLGVARTHYDVLIEAPAGVSLKVRGDDDDYRISDIHGAIALAADDGSIRLRNCHGTDFDLAFEDGELDMDRGAGLLRLRYDDGDADIRGAAFDHVHVQANDGTLRLTGDLSQDGQYDFKLDDGDMDLRLGNAHGAFTFTFADGTLNLEGGRGDIELRYDDGTARLSGTAFQQLRVLANDGEFDFDGSVPAAADYAVRLDDGQARFHARDGGGRISTRFDDGRVNAGDSLRLATRAGRGASYEWGDGDAEVAIDFNDGSANLSAGAR
jgi:hypothetical protein